MFCSSPFLLHAGFFALLAVLSSGLASLVEQPWHAAVGAVLVCLAWARSTLEVVEAHGFRVLIRAVYSNVATLREGSFVLAYPEYSVRDRSQFGPWRSRSHLPVVGQVLDIDVPEVLVPVEQGLYCLKVNTKAMGTVQSYSAEDLMQNPIAIERRIHDVIANALRNAVHDKGLEDALVEVQRIFSKDAAGISAMISVPAFQVTQLMLDATEQVSPADVATRAALDIILQRKQEAAKRAVIEASMDTEERSVKLRRIALQSSREELMLQQEVYGKEGAALVEAAKHAKVLYLCTGSGVGVAPVLPSSL